MTNELAEKPMSYEEMIDTLKGLVFGTFDRTTSKEREALSRAIDLLSNSDEDCISRKELLKKWGETTPRGRTEFDQVIMLMPRIQPRTEQYEKHIDHTDCIWYGSDSGCPVTCSQYRDGWNDAMDYIFTNGKGYQPYRHDG